MSIIVPWVIQVLETENKERATEVAGEFLSALHTATPHPSTVDFSAEYDMLKINQVRTNFREFWQTMSILPKDIMRSLAVTPAASFFLTNGKKYGLTPQNLL